MGSWVPIFTIMLALIHVQDSKSHMCKTEASLVNQELKCDTILVPGG